LKVKWYDINYTLNWYFKPFAYLFYYFHWSDFNILKVVYFQVSTSILQIFKTIKPIAKILNWIKLFCTYIFYYLHQLSIIIMIKIYLKNSLLNVEVFDIIFNKPNQLSFYDLIFVKHFSPVLSDTNWLLLPRDQMFDFFHFFFLA